LQYFRLCMWRQVGTLHWSCSSAPTKYGNSHESGFITQNTVNTSCYSQLSMNGWLSSMSWKYWGHFRIVSFGCRRRIQSHFITLSQYTMTCSITWMAWRELWPRRRLNGKKTCSSLWSKLDRTFPNTTLKWLQRWACYIFPYTSSILSGSCDRLEPGTWEWILILRTRHAKLHNTERRLWGMSRMNSVPNIDLCWSINLKPYQAAISSPLQWFQGPNNHPLIHMTCPAMMRNT